jgi:hypothetical protein
VSELARFEADLDFTFDILESFFKRARVQRALQNIEEMEVTGWEKWWQIELALYVDEHPEVAEWDMEEPFFTDRRTSTQKDFVAIDLCFRRKKHSSESMVFLELKQDLDWKRCVNNMMRDAEKVYGCHSRSHSGAAIRNFFLAGVYPSEQKAVVHDYIKERAEELDVAVDLVDSKFIPNTNFTFTLF